MHSLFIKTNHWISQEGSSRQFTINQLPLSQWCSINFLKDGLWNQNISSKKIIVCASDSSARETHQLLSKNLNSVIYLAPEHSPYDSLFISNAELDEHIEKINTIYSNDFDILVTTFRSLLLSIPKNLVSGRFVMNKNEEYSHGSLLNKLSLLGYTQTTALSGPSQFSIKGEILDVWISSSGPYRIHFFDDLVEEINPIDLDTFKSIRDRSLDTLIIPGSQSSFTSEEHVNQLRRNIPQPPPAQKEKWHLRKGLIQKVQDSEPFENNIYIFPLLFEDQTSAFEELKDKALFIFENFESSMGDFEVLIDQLHSEYNEENSRDDSEIILPEPDKIFHFSTREIFKNLKSLFVNSLNISESLNEDISSSMDINSQSLKEFSFNQENTELSLTEKVFRKIKDINHSLDRIYFFYEAEESREKFKHLLETYDVPPAKIEYCESPLLEGFYYPQDESLVLSDHQIFRRKKERRKKKRKKKYDLFAEQIATLQPNDFVIHKNHGVGKYLGIQNLAVSGDDSDFVVIQYKDDDKVYVPVYHLNLVQKYGDATAEHKLADLKSKRFNQEKSKARGSVKKLAFDLLKLQAEREAFQGYSYAPPGEDYEQFSSLFPFELTPDQAQATDDILEDLQKIRPMDRLVCGDVGFGKTEVAMRAAFKAIEDGKQVAVLVPTTILCLQHYMNFKERFSNFPVQIEFLSRLKTTKETNEIIEKTNEGKVDVLIGTHKLLSSKLKYQNLGLVIIDEEHRFGVSHKEKLKVLKTHTDFLTLTATPIPRTLQLSFLGIKELSLIQTPPPKRQSINTYVIREDKSTIKSAIKKELSRGGQVFFIHNKVQDIELVVNKIRELAPKAKIVYAHGQLPEKELEKRIYSFYNKEYDILVSTTIVESGIDIPTANTMIINNAQNFGLAQLHQLRGRIGRSNQKAYCYFVIPKYRKLSDTATKRLEALQKYAELGSGFAIANSDLDIRGAGNLLGAEQSGHINSIGLELYLEMLNEAVSDLKGEVKDSKVDNVDVQSFFSSYLPDSYIADQQTRLKYYKKISNAKTIEQLEDTGEELLDIFGKLPEPTENLLNLIAITNEVKRIGVKTLKLKMKQTIIGFDLNYLENHPEFQQHVASFFLKSPNKYKVQPNLSVIIHKTNKTSQDCREQIFKLVRDLLV